MKGCHLGKHQISSRRTRDGYETGLTLVELLVAMAIFAVITAVVFSVINSFESTQNAVYARQQGTSAGMVVFNRMTRDIRNAQIPSGGPVFLYPTTTAAGTSYSVTSNQIELNTTNPDGSPTVVCIIVHSSTTTVSSTDCQTTPTSVPSCPCTLTALTIGTGGGSTLRYQVQDLTAANIFTLTAPTGSSTFQSVAINAALQPNPSEPAVAIQNTIELRNVALSS